MEWHSVAELFFYKMMTFNTLLIFNEHIQVFFFGNNSYRSKDYCPHLICKKKKKLQINTIKAQQIN